MHNWFVNEEEIFGFFCEGQYQLQRWHLSLLRLHAKTYLHHLNLVPLHRRSQFYQTPTQPLKTGQKHLITFLLGLATIDSSLIAKIYWPLLPIVNKYGALDRISLCDKDAKWWCLGIGIKLMVVSRLLTNLSEVPHKIHRCIDSR